LEAQKPSSREQNDRSNLSKLSRAFGNLNITFLFGRIWITIYQSFYNDKKITVSNPFLISPNPYFISTSKYSFKLRTKFKPPMKNYDLLQNWPTDCVLPEQIHHNIN